MQVERIHKRLSGQLLRNIPATGGNQTLQNPMTTTHTPNDKESLKVVPLETDAPVPVVLLNDNAPPDGGYGWICVVAVGCGLPERTYIDSI